MSKTSFLKQVVLLLLFVLLLASCNKDINMDGWEPDMLVPIVKAKASVKEVADLRDKTFVQNIPAIDIGYTPMVPVNVPATEISAVGPYSFTLSEFFSAVEVDSAVFGFELNNAFPIPISRGTKVVFRSSEDVSSDANIIYAHELSQDIPAFGTYSATEVVINRTVTSKVFLYLESFKTQGATDVVFSTNAVQLSFDIKFLRVFKAAINTGKEYSISDTTSMELGETIADYNDSTATGLLKVFVNSSMPVNFSYQLYFLDESKSVLIDSLYYGDMYSPGCTVNSAGEPVDALERKFEIVLSPERIAKLRNAKHMAYRLSGNTHGYNTGVVYINGDCFLQVQLTGDVKLKVGVLLPG